jgi:hypothetical protein
MRIFQNVCRSLGTILTNRNDVHDESRGNNYGKVCHYSENLISHLLSKTLKIRMYEIFPVLPLGVKSGFLP